MSLNWNVQAVPKEVAFNDKGMTPLTHTLIWATLITHMGSITTQNYAEFYRRLNLWQRSKGALLQQDGSEHYITLAEVQSNIGLKTNMSTKTPKGWDKWFKESLFRDASDKVYLQKETA